MHSHAPKPTNLETKEKRRLIEESTKDCSEVKANVTPRQILSGLINQIKDPDAIAMMPSYDSDRQCIQRTRSECPSEPDCLKTIDIPTNLKETLTDNEGNTENFLLHDSGIDDQNRFFIYSTKKNLKLLENSDIFADRTFNIAPTNFVQVYSLHTLVDGICLPFVFCLLPHKTEAI
ncbi:hypothetical protein BpHYR1_014370 [Brachionus plicatilis]|uniref:Uncharacterized protein n=1 Tax=Brachionus plicatilis TaxID=10195 RepID=A0A3M7RLM9_BRAPC|nr:hypothetical protein BpHYR1_014370 [Brachionus plicatilis]